MDKLEEELFGGKSSETEGDEQDGVFVTAPIRTKDDRELTTLSCREPSVGECLLATRTIGKRPTLETVYASEIALLCRVTGWPQTAVDQLPTRTLDAAVAYISHFEEEARRKPDEEPECQDTFYLSLTPPITAVNRDWQDMDLREPTVAERRRFKAQEQRGSMADFLEAEINLLTDVSGWQRAAVLKMPISQFAKASDYLTGFFIAGQKTGNVSLPI
ncbi:phage tail assembly protein [Acetobacter malorum]|uniref:phage tail assembly protein n=1 Tax=Acetobacter malorum TaxID=178901 RepID=UPI0007771FD2|nr:phage tail assembly protein [Acetobacter malorum]